MNTKHKGRNSNLEILRIIAIIMIIISHYCVHGIKDNINTLEISKTNKIISDSLILGDIGVIIFILIFGYFYNQNKLKLDKIISLILQVFFYSFGIYTIFCLLKITPFSISNLIKSVFPIAFQEYWFITAYMILYILSPFFKTLIDNMSRKNFIALLLVLSFIWSVLPMGLSIFSNKDIMFSSSLTDLILIYFIGAYLKKYEDNIFNKNSNKMLILICITSLILIISVIVFNILSSKIPIIAQNCSYLYKRNSPFAILLGISILIYFSSKPEKHVNTINKIASLSFGIYLIHDNPYVRKILWTSLLKIQNYTMSNIFILHIIISIVLIYTICAVIEKIRQMLYNALLSKSVKNICSKISKKIELNKETNL